MSILKFKKTFISQSYLTVSVLGNSLKLNVKYTNTPTVELNKNENEIDLFLPKKYFWEKAMNNLKDHGIVYSKLVISFPFNSEC